MCVKVLSTLKLAMSKQSQGTLSPEMDLKGPVLFQLKIVMREQYPPISPSLSVL